MQASYNWIQSYLIKKLPEPKALVELLTMRIFETEEPIKNGSDWLLDIDVLPDRGGDCLSHYGLAREIAALTGNKLKKIEATVKEGKTKTNSLLQVEVPARDLCFRYCGRVIEGVKVGPSPDWLKERLESIGVKSINNVVDVTNFVLLETGQPLHSFDGAKVAQKDNKWQIIVRRAQDKEKIKTLDGSEKELTQENLVIADPDKAIALAGVMGGANTEISSNSQTIILESANFELRNIRKTAKSLDLRTESSMRFEQGVDPDLASWALDRAAFLINQLSGGQASSKMLDYYPHKVKSVKIKLKTEKVTSLLGIKIPEAKIKSILTSLGLEVKKIADGFEIKTPTFRDDLKNQADLIEEIGRVYGYENIPASLPEAVLIPPAQNDDLIYTRKTKDILAGLGFIEVYNYSFFNSKFQEKHAFSALELTNPVSQEQKYLRTCLIPNLLKNVKDNFKYFDQVKIFEVGRIFEQDISLDKGVYEEKRLSGLIAKKENDSKDFYSLKGSVDTLFKKMGLADLWYDDHIEEKNKILTLFHPARRAEVKIGEERLGWLAEIDQETLKEIGIKGQVVAFEINLDKLAQLATEERIYQAPSKYPALVRDLAVLVERGNKVAEVLNLINTAGGQLIRDVDLFDMYEGERLPTGKKSLAFHIIYQADDRTLTEKEVDDLHWKIIKILEEEGGWEVRK